VESAQRAAAAKAPAGYGAPGSAGSPLISPGPAAVLDLAGCPDRFWLVPPAKCDLPRITAMWERCSLVTRIGRFHAPVRNIPASYLRIVLSDPSTSLVAVHGQAGAVAALASLVLTTGSSAELGVLVEDAWQRRGIGRQLVTRLIGAASASQISELTASVLAENAKVADLLRQVPGDFSLTRDGTTISVRVRLAPATAGIPECPTE
jgi:GNAT superfamily N-acetyltransferase